MEEDEIKRTLVPWVVGEPGGPAGPFYSIVSSEGRVIAMRVVNETDAHLIAAAPDLLEACKIALPLIPFTGDQTDEFGASRMLEEAIAKAEGKQP